jgi:osmotically-inducible protein OsmY
MRTLVRNPEVDASTLAVAAHNGTVTLRGCVDTYEGKLAAERAVRRVPGVCAVANDLVVRLRLDDSDADLVQDAVHELELCGTIPNTVQARVHGGHVTLTGRVESLRQKERAEKAVRRVRGVRHVLNHIAVASKAATRDVRSRITRALRQNIHADASHITVTVYGDTATLLGTVATRQQREAAERAAASAPAIAHVDSQLIVQAVSDSKDDDVRTIGPGVRQNWRGRV